jgi:hypothetical protein
MVDEMRRVAFGVGLAVRLAALLVCTPLPGCVEGRSACEFCRDATPATFHLSCSPNDLTSVVASGPCSMPNTAGLAFQTPTSGSDVAVFSAGAGVCHIELTFATGFTYSTDVTFTQVSEDGCACPSLFAAISGPFTVNNPSDTCVDAGLDAQAVYPETGADEK